MARIVAVFGGSVPVAGDPDYEDGVEAGRLLAEAGFGVATGGYGGLMEAVSAGAAAGGGRVIGVTAPEIFPGRSAPNVHLTEERRTATLMERIGELTGLSAASLALPGSIGTLTELVAAWNLAYVTRFSDTAPKPVVTVGERWRQIIADLTEVLDTDGSLVTCCETVSEGVEVVRQLLRD